MSSLEIPPVDIPFTALADKHGALVTYTEIVAAYSDDAERLAAQIAIYGEQTKLQGNIPLVTAACGRLAAFAQNPSEHRTLQTSIVLEPGSVPKDFFRVTVDPFAGVTQYIERMKRSIVPTVTGRELDALKKTSAQVRYGKLTNNACFHAIPNKK